MTENPYDYWTRMGILPISWEAFHGICKALALAIGSYDPEILLPVGRAGYYPGTLLAHMLQVELFPIRLSRRVNDIVKFDDPQWLLDPPAAVSGRRVLIVDEICSSGATIRMVGEKVVSMGASQVRSAVLYAHERGAGVPDYIGIITDALVLNPWDREVVREGGFHFHPEYVEALKQQGLDATSDLLIPATPITLAKG
jgi:uncharacterized protein